VVLAGAVLMGLWPTAAILFGAVLVVLALCVRAPLYAFALALVLFSFEGTFKMRLSVEGAPSPAAIGAVGIDLAVFAALTALLVSDYGRAPARLWQRAPRPVRVALALLVAWMVLSVLQIPLGGDLVDGLEGFRLTQAYVPAVLGGVVIAASLEEEHLARLLLAVILLAVVYAAFRGVTGPTHNEQLYAEQRDPTAAFEDLGRNIGSFSAPFGLVSFLVPAALLSLGLAVLRAERRVVWGALFLLAMTGIIASFVRTAPLAVVAGAALLALLLLARRGAARRRGAFAIVVVAAVLGGGYAATQLAADVSPVTKYRAESLADPFSDDSVTRRFDRWGRTLEKVADQPWGTGLGTVGRATLQGHRAVFTDNSYLKVVQEQGFLGGLLFIGGLAGLSVAVAVGLVRRDPLRRPVGTAALVAFSGFLVLMTMGEYIEQPGKVLAWVLLGVALWEAYGDGPAVATAG
jgi:hypothetical protein